ncbi:MAG: DNA polymerase IV, partial [Planctomycetota bacterium]
MSSTRKIIHIDMDAFFASVEQRDHPQLRDRPVVVGGDPSGRGVVAAASYQARRYGIRSAMSCARAQRLCPATVFVRPDLGRYQAVSRQIHAIFARFTNLIEPLSLDEAYLDVSGATSATAIAEAIRSAIGTELNLTASAGVGPNKLIAKIASDANKPDGLCVVRPQQAADFLAPLPLRRIPGIGPVSAERCQRAGLATIADLRQADAATLHPCFGNQADHFRDLAWGQDQRPVRHQRVRKSVGVEDTVTHDLTTAADLHALLASLADKLAQRLARHALGGRTLTLKIRYADFTTISRSHTLRDSITETDDLRAIAQDLLDRHRQHGRGIRLLG